MSEQSFNLMLVLSSAGLALMLAGGSRLLFAKQSLWIRLPFTAASFASAAVLPILFAPGYMAVPAVAAALVCSAMIGCIGSSRFASFAHRTSAFVRRPVGQGIVLGSFGLIVIAGSFAYLTWEETDAIDRDMELLAELTSTPPLHTAQVAQTDAAREINLWSPDTPRLASELNGGERRLLASRGYSEKLIRTANADDVCNCHGWVFAAGKYWVASDQVDLILNDNGYQPVSDPRPGDLAIYRQKGEVVHTAIVRVSGEPSQILVEGKWGWMGVFLHRVGDSSYGKEFTFYRGPRSSHVVLGVDNAQSPNNFQVQRRPANPIPGQ